MAVLLLIGSRRGHYMWGPPDVADCVESVERRYPMGKAAILTAWQKAISSISEATTVRSSVINRALWWCGTAVLLLAIPFVASVIRQVVVLNW